MSVIARFPYVILACFVNSFDLIEVGASCFISAHGTSILEKNLNYWSKDLEEVVFEKSSEDISSLKTNLLGKKLVSVHKGCGKMYNRLGILSDGGKICIRYRDNVEQIQGEIVSYCLGSLLGLQNVIDAKLLLVNDTEEFWEHVGTSTQSWKNLELVVVTKFIEDALPVYIPDLLLRNNFQLNQNSSLCGLDELVLKYLIQWTDMIILDYLIGNFDRFVSNMFNLQWYSQSLVEPIENLIRLKNGFWVFIDNEEGFSHGYRLIEKYEPYLKKLLKNICIFRRQTVENINKLSKLDQEDIGRLLLLEAKGTFSSDGIEAYFPGLSERNLSILKHRIDFVHEHISVCDQQEP